MLSFDLPASLGAYDSTFAKFALTGILSSDVIGMYTAADVNPEGGQV
jgi:hypothetical protein